MEQKWTKVQDQSGVKLERSFRLMGSRGAARRIGVCGSQSLSVLAGAARLCHGSMHFKDANTRNSENVWCEWRAFFFIRAGRSSSNGAKRPFEIEIIKRRGAPSPLEDVIELLLHSLVHCTLRYLKYLE